MFAKRSSSITLALAAAGLSTAPALAKDGHLEDVKFALLQTRISCATCHPDPEGKTLTNYGRRLADLGNATSLQERVRDLERRSSDVALKANPAAEKARTDIDGDGTLNWVEILVGTSPSDPADKPDAGVKNEHKQQVEAVVNCGLCHVDNNVTPVGEDKAPHNPLGDALQALAKPLPGKESAPPPEFMPRFEQVLTLDTDRDKARNWHEIATFHSPTDITDTPTEDELKQIKELLKASKKPDAGFGRAHQPKRP